MNYLIYKDFLNMAEKLIWPGATQLAPVPVVMLGCGDGSVRNPDNLITVAWCGTLCSEPPMLGVGIRPERFSFGLIRRTGEFSVNLPCTSLSETVDYCGVVSGRTVDKFKERKLTAERGAKIKAPLVAECPINLECIVKEALELGSHWFFIAEIVAVRVKPELVDANGKLDIERADLLAYTHGSYRSLGPAVGSFGFSVRKNK